MTAQKVLFYFQKTQKTSISLSKISRLLSTDEFFNFLQISLRRVWFLEAEIDAWLATKAAKNTGLYLAHGGKDFAPAAGYSND